jgi:divalent metal cation (Fe/Co/Zn/Cd) transporter
VVLVPGVVSLLLALQWAGSQYPWNDGRIIALFVVFGVLIIAFFGVQVWEGETYATISLRLMKDRNILGGVWYGVCIGAVLMIFTYYVSPRPAG